MPSVWVWGGHFHLNHATWQRVFLLVLLFRKIFIIYLIYWYLNYYVFTFIKFIYYRTYCILQLGLCNLSKHVFINFKHIIYLNIYLYNLKIYAELHAHVSAGIHRAQKTSAVVFCEPPNLGSKTLTPALYKSHACFTPLYCPLGSPTGFSEIGFHMVQADFELTR